MVIKTEDDSNDAAECPHDDKPSSGMFGFLLCVYLAYLHCTLISSGVTSSTSRHWKPEECSMWR